MKIILFSRPGLDLDPAEIKTIFSSLTENGLGYAVNSGFADSVTATTGIEIPEELRYDRITPELTENSIMVSYGGDGTFLEASKIIYNTNIPIIGINYGHLGFLTSVPRNELKEVFRQLSEKKYSLEKRTLLRIEGDFGQEVEHPYALNEFSLHRTGNGMVNIEVFVGSDKLATFRGDGTIVATPTGSTAYSLSAGGPIVAPDCSCFVISPIAPHNLTMRPVVIQDSSVLTFTLGGRDPYGLVSLDNRSFMVPNGASFKVLKAEKSIFLVKLQNISFYDTLRNKMMWGLDGRDSDK